MRPRLSVTALLGGVLAPLAGWAHQGELAHAHPHGIEYGWLIAVAVAGAGGYAIARVQARVAARRGSMGRRR